MKARTYVTIGILSLVFLLLCSMASLAFGSKSIPLQDVWYALSHPLDTSFSSVVVLERIPRTLFALLAGAALGVAGAIMQSVTRNPIADPSILGVNTGASLFVVGGIAFLQITTLPQYIFMALLGAGITAVLVYVIASLGIGGATQLKLALSGAVMSAALTSMISAIMLPRAEVMNTFRFWQVGSVSGATWEGLISVLPFIIVGMLLAFAVSPSLNILALGEEMAVNLGVKTGIVRLIGVVSGVLLCGSITALAGPIGFIGLMVPHVMRYVLGPDLRMNLVMSAIGGAALLTCSDIIGRLIGSPGELEVGIITAFIGAPILIMIVVKAKVHAL